MDSNAGHLPVHVDKPSSGIECCETRISSSSAKPISYTDYLASILQGWPEYEPLYNYLLKPWKDTVFHTRVLVGSLAETTIDFEEFVFDAERMDHVEAALMNLSVALQNFLQSKDSGLLFVENNGSNFCSAVIEIIGRSLDVDPSFFDIAILYELWVYRSRESLTDYPHPRPPISRDRGILRLHDKLAAQIVTKERCGEDVPVVLMFANTEALYPKPHMHSALVNRRPSINRPGERPLIERAFPRQEVSGAKAGHVFMKLISKLQAPEVQEARQNPCLFIFSWIYFLAQDLSLTIHTLCQTHQANPYIKSLEEEFERFEGGNSDLLKAAGVLRGAIDNFDALIRDLRATAPYNQNPESPLYRRLLGYCTEVQNEGRRLLQTIQEKTQLDIGLWSIKESQRSIEEAVAVKKLTQLAFIFIPLSFVTSIFGMNIDEITGTGAKLWTFLVTAACIGISVSLIWWLSSPLEQWWRNHPKRYDDDYEGSRYAWIWLGIRRRQLWWMIRHGVLTAFVTGARFGNPDYSGALLERLGRVGSNELLLRFLS